MTPTHFRWLVATTAGAALVAAVTLTGGPDGAAQEKKGEPAAKGAPVNTVHCRQCHSGPNSEGYQAYKDEGRTDFVRLDEYPTWKTHDLHATALTNITPDPKGGPDGKGNLAWQMQEVLQAASPARKDIKDYKVHQADECLTCHAVDRQPGAVGAGHMDMGGRFYTKEGVGCEACHGLVRAEWVGLHIEGWRTVPPDEKYKKHGQVDLRDPYTRAMKCASCHVGNKDEGKFVTHEMYAAGHPPLPAFEPVTFARQAPPHYHSPRQNKALAALPAADALKLFHYRSPAEECPGARDLAVGAVAGFEATMNLLAKDAADTKPGELLDFAHFDCYACHHDLKVPSWRQKRRYRGAPGRPTMKPWSTETLLAVLDHAKAANGFKTEETTRAADAFRKALGELNKQFDVRPFGDPAKIAEQAKAFRPTLQAVRTVLNEEGAVYSPAQTEALYQVLKERLLKSASGGKPGEDGLYLDHDAAQQAVWALLVLREELRAARWIPEVSEATLTPAEAALNAVTELRVRPAQRGPVAGPRLQTRLKNIGAFEPDVFLPKAREWLQTGEKK